MDVVVLGGLLVVKLETDPLIVVVARITIVTTYVAEGFFLRRGDSNPPTMHTGH